MSSRTFWPQGRPHCNLFLSAPSPELIDALSTMGMDSLTIDMQHGLFDPAHLRGAIRASRIPALVRLADNTTQRIGKALDYGAAGLICPMIESVADTEAFVEACYYPPRGTRSFGPVRVAEPTGYLERNRADTPHIRSFAMIETTAAWHAVEDISRVDHLTGLYVGPFDLSLSMGLERPGDLSQPELQAAVERVLTVAKKQGLHCGIFLPGTDDARWAAAQGFDLISLGTEEQVLQSALKEKLNAVRGGD